MYYKILYLLGKGYSSFIWRNFLFLQLGFNNYILIKIPKFIYVYRFKKKIYFLSIFNNILTLFLNNYILMLKKKIIYLGYGMSIFKNISFYKLKKGKSRLIS